MHKKLVLQVFLVILLLLFFVLFLDSVSSLFIHHYISPAPALTQRSQSVVATTTSADPQRETYAILKVVDGDTVDVSLGGTRTRIRLIGINTPETVDPRRPVQCFGKEASARAKELLSAKKVFIELDPSQDKYDKYGRLLAYIYLPDGSFFNELMIEEGYAYEYTYRVPYKYQQEFKQAEHEARTNKRGLWADGVCASFSTTSVTR